MARRCGVRDREVLLGGCSPLTWSRCGPDCQDVFEAVVEYARSLGGLLYSDSASQKMAVRQDLHETMKAFISRQQLGR